MNAIGRHSEHRRVTNTFPWVWLYVSDFFVSSRPLLGTTPSRSGVRAQDGELADPVPCDERNSDTAVLGAG
jgi:hypothetical protein